MDFNKPDYMVLTGNICENFRRFKQEIQIYFLATETNKKIKRYSGNTVFKFTRNGWE